MKTLFMMLILAVSVSAKTNEIDMDFVFDNAVNRDFVYDWAVEKSSITTWKGQEEIRPYEITYGTPTVTGYGLKIVLRTDIMKPSYKDAILDKLQWLRDHMGNTILRAKVDVHICDNDEHPQSRRGCVDHKRIYYKNIIS